MTLQITHGPSPHPLNQIEGVCGQLMGKMVFFKSDSITKKQKEQTLLHIVKYIINFNQNYSTPVKLLSTSFLSLEKWSHFIRFSRSIPNVLASLTNSQKDHFLLGEGVCVGTIVHYFSQFFQHYDLTKASLYPCQLVPNTNAAIDVKFYSFLIKNLQVLEKIRPFRFLQAAYKTASALVREKDSLEFVPHRILHKQKLEIRRRIPSLKESKINRFEVNDLVPELKKLMVQSKNIGYLLALGGVGHALALYLRPPFHFMDPRAGIVVAENREDLALCLASYVTENYPEAHSFAMLEFASKIPQKNLLLQLVG